MLSSPRSHSPFSSMTPNPLKTLNRDKLEKWIASKLKSKESPTTNPDLEPETQQSEEYMYEFGLEEYNHEETY